MDRSDLAAAYLAKATASLEAAEREFAADGLDACANRAYYACFQAAVAALIREGIWPDASSGQWGHAFVETRFVGQLIHRRHRFPSELRAVLSDNRALRQKGDYEPDAVTGAEASRSLRRGRVFVGAIRAKHGESR